MVNLSPFEMETYCFGIVMKPATLLVVSTAINSGGGNSYCQSKTLGKCTEVEAITAVKAAVDALKPTSISGNVVVVVVIRHI